MAQDRSVWLVARTGEQADSTLQGLHARGLVGLAVPVLRFEPVDPGPVDWSDAGAIALTSPQGAKRLGSLAGVPRDLPVFTSGDMTGRAARRVGFADVRSAGDDGAALVALLGRSLPTGTIVVYPGAERTSRDLREMATTYGLDVRPVCVYRSVPEERLPAEVHRALGEGRTAGVLLFSAMGAAAFASLLDRACLRDRAATLTAVCLSGAIADRLRTETEGWTWKEIVAAGHPSLPALLDLLPNRKTVAATG